MPRQNIHETPSRRGVKPLPPISHCPLPFQPSRRSPASTPARRGTKLGLPFHPRLPMVRAKSLLLLGLLALVSVTASAAEPAGKLAPKPLYRDPVYDGAADPVVIWNPHAKRWWMFYTNRRANVPGLSGVT